MVLPVPSGPLEKFALITRQLWSTTRATALNTFEGVYVVKGRHVPLPAEIWFQILGLLPRTHLRSLSTVNKQIGAIVETLLYNSIVFQPGYQSSIKAQVLIHTLQLRSQLLDHIVTLVTPVRHKSPWGAAWVDTAQWASLLSKTPNLTSLDIYLYSTSERIMAIPQIGRSSHLLILKIRVGYNAPGLSDQVSKLLRGQPSIEELYLESCIIVPEKPGITLERLKCLTASFDTITNLAPGKQLNSLNALTSASLDTFRRSLLPLSSSSSAMQSLTLHLDMDDHDSFHRLLSIIEDIGTGFPNLKSLILGLRGSNGRIWNLASMENIPPYFAGFKRLETVSFTVYAERLVDSWSYQSFVRAISAACPSLRVVCAPNNRLFKKAEGQWTTSQNVNLGS